MRILKFGGSSIGSPDGFRKVVNIITQTKNDGPLVIVVSALGGVTNKLIELIDDSIAQSDSLAGKLHDLLQRHLDYSETFVAETYRDACISFLKDEKEKLQKKLTGIALLEECTPKARDFILSFGEKCAQRLLYDSLRSNGLKVISPEAGSLIQTNSHYGAARVNQAGTFQIIREKLQNLAPEEVAVTAGFLGHDKDGSLTTLGRDGSDYTAALIGAGLNARQVEIWSDVDGVLNSDPDIINEAELLLNMHYREAAEIAFFGAKVLHPKTIRPLEQANITIIMKNTFNPDCPGTRISADQDDNPNKVKVITAKNEIVLFNIYVKKARQSSLIFSRFLELLDHLEIPSFMTNQSSSDASFSVAINAKYAEELQIHIDDTFSDGFSENYISHIDKQFGFSVVSAIGLNISRSAPVVAGFFNALSDAGIESQNISFGVSGHNISTLVRNADSIEAVKILFRNLLMNKNYQSLKLAVNQ
ncbi:MAG: aspartate kinase [Calditrichae bacterium]|nr:aspartate kinase [Calditrichota bacterium]MCB9058692.1 aspartate kinase [Calditrichia bacterium]